MKVILLAAFLCVCAVAQTTSTLTLSLTFPTGVLSDIFTHWTDGRGALLGTIGAPVGSSDTSITLGQQVSVAAGVSVLVVDAAGTVEPMAVSAPATSAQTITVVRAFPGFSPSAHAVGANVYALTYATPLQLMAAEVLRTWVNGIVVTLAAQGRSAMIPQLTGTMSLGQ